MSWFRPLSGQRLRGVVDGSADALVRAAAADVAIHGAVDIGVARFWRLGQKADRGHDLSRLAIAALDHVELAPCGLDRLRDPTVDALDRRDLAVADVTDAGLA